MKPELDHKYIAKKGGDTVKIHVVELTQASIRIYDTDTKWYDRYTIEDFERKYALIEDLGHIGFLEYMGRR